MHLRRASALLLTCAFSSCGSATQVRPHVIDTYPAANQVLAGPLAEIRVTYDGPVRILNPDDFRIFTEEGALVGARATQREGESSILYLRPAGHATFPLDTRLAVLLIEGIVVNTLDHYADDPVEFPFTCGSEPPLLFGRPGTVTLLDSATFGLIADVPTPGGRDPVGLVSTIHGTMQKIWVQLANGGGTGASLAWFTPGDAAMTAVTLPAAVDLVATSSSIAVGPDGAYLYAAYRDTDSGRVRVVRVDTATALPAGVLDLESAAPGAGTAPVDLRPDADASRLVVAAADGATGVLAYIDRLGFTENDRDPATPGIQGDALLSGPGRMDLAGGRYWVALPGTNDMDVVAPAGSVSSSAGTVTGTDAGVLAMLDRAFLVQGLAGYTGNAALQIRSDPANLLATSPVDVSDDVGGVDRGATAVVDLQLLPGPSRFAVLLSSPGGLLLARFTYTPHFLVQEDLDPLTVGVQVVDVQAVVPGATLIGRTYGAFAP